jgi:hypothetical protein
LALPNRTFSFDFILASFIINLYRPAQAGLDQGSIRWREFAAPLALLLEHMQDVNGPSQPNGIDCAIRVAVEIIEQLQDATSAKALESFCSPRRLAGLCDSKSDAELPLHGPGHGLQIVVARADPGEPAWYRLSWHTVNITEL